MEHPFKDFFNVAQQVNEIGQKTNKWEEKLKLFNETKKNDLMDSFKNFESSMEVAEKVEKIFTPKLYK